MNRRTMLIVGIIVLLVIVIPAGWYLASPLFIDNRVDEAFPVAAERVPEAEEAANAADAVSEETAVESGEDAAGGDADADSGEASSTIEETESPTAETSDESGTPEETSATAPEADETLEDKVMDEPMPTEPSVLGQGQFVDADSFHQGEGSATIYELPDGQRIVRFEDFEVTNGPDLHVLLAEGATPEDQDALGEYLDLGMLKGNIGNQNYELPADVDPQEFQSVVIYCMPFHVVFATATLEFAE